MIDLAIVALIIWSVQIALRWHHYRQRLSMHGELVYALTNEIEALTRQAENARAAGASPGSDPVRDVRARKLVLDRELKHVGRLREAMNHPWRHFDDEAD